MKKYISLIFLILLLSFQASYGYDDCSKEYKKIMGIHEEVKKIKIENSQLIEKIKKRYPSASPTFINKVIRKEGLQFVDRLNKLEILLDGYEDDFSKCKDKTDKKIQEEDDKVNTYFQKGNAYAKVGDYLNAIKYYKKAKAIYTAEEITSNLSLAYFEYANGRVYKEKYDEAIKYYNLALKEGYLHTYNIHLNKAFCYYLKAKKNNFDTYNLKQAVSYYQDALKVTSDFKEIQEAKSRIQEIKDIISNKNKQEAEEKLEKQERIEQIKLEKENKKKYEQEQIQAKRNEKSKDRANNILDKIDSKTKGYSQERRLKLYNRYILLLTKYSNTKAKGDVKFIVDFIVKGMQRKVDNNFEDTVEDLLGL